MLTYSLGFSVGLILILAALFWKNGHHEMRLFINHMGTIATAWTATNFIGFINPNHSNEIVLPAAVGLAYTFVFVYYQRNEADRRFREPTPIDEFSKH